MYRSLIARRPALRRPTPFESLERRVLLSAAQAYAVTDLPYSTGDPVMTTSVGGAAFLGVAGRTVYRSYGTAADTSQFNSGIREVHEWDGMLYTSFDSFLYRSGANSFDMTQITDAADNLRLERATHFVHVGDKLYFNADSQDTLRRGMFVLDRSETAARYVGPGTPLGAAGGRLLYTTYTQTPGIGTWTLWATDAATDGATAEKLADDFYPGQAFNLNDSTLLIDGPGGLWKSDGTPGGTALIKPDAGGVRQWLRVGDSVYYLNSVTARPSGLWKTDGTPEGTVLVRDAVAGVDATPNTHPSLTHVGDTVYFASYPDAGGPRQLFATRGPGTTRQVTSIGSDPLMDGVFFSLAAVGENVFFAARPDSTGYNLWQTDGTRVSQVQLAGPAPAADAGPPIELVASGGSLYFTRVEFDGPNRLWRYGVIPAVVDPDGTLVVYGTDPAEGVAGNDEITLSASADTVSAVVNGETFSFPAASVRRITVNALGGDDVLTLDDAVRVPVAYNASSGVETFALDGTAGDDVIAVEADGVRVGDRQYWFSNLDRLTVRGLGGNDSITIDGTPAAEVTVDGGAGDERVVVRPTSPSQQPPSGRLTVFGGAGANSLVLDDSARSSAQQYDLSEFSLGRPADYPGGPVPPPLQFADFEAGVSLVAGEGADVIRVTPGGKAPLSVEGGPPAAGGQAPGDAIALVPAGAAGARLEPSPGGGGRYTFDNRQPVPFTGIEIPDNLRDPSATACRAVDTFGTTHVAVTFDEPVLMPEVPGSALRLTNLSTGQTIDPATVGATSVSTTTELVFRFVNAGRPFSLPSGRYEATVPAGSVSDFAGHATASDFTFTFSVAPRIVGAWATGTTWAPSFRERLPNRTGPGTPIGWRLDGNPQSWLVPWTGLNQFVARFDGPVEADAADLSVRGTNVKNYPVVDYAYDPATYTARWTLGGAVDVDKVVFTLDGHSAAGVRGGGAGVAAGTGPLMDGEDKRAGSTPYPTGDGVAGGDFHGYAWVLPGDARADGQVVNALDLATVRQALNRSAPPPGQSSNGYSIYSDVVPDGRINSLDLAAVRRHYNRSLPAAQPSVAAQPSPAVTASALGEADLISLATRSLFSQRPVL